MIVPHQPLPEGRSVLELVAQVEQRLAADPLATRHPPVLVATPPPDPAAWAARLTSAAALPLAVTDHALLVVLGQFAHHLGLIQRLQQIPIPQRTHAHTPQTKLIQFFVGILAGLDYLHDFNDAPQPLLRDRALLARWGLAAFAHYSGVSRTLAAADERTLAAVQQVLQAISQPFLAAEVTAMMRQAGGLVVDIDLTGREVSPTSTSSVDADFGWMDAAIHKGYQALVLSLSGGPTGRVVLQGRRYAGRTQSAEVLQAAVVQLEAQLGGHPRRRTELVQARLDALQAKLHATTQALAAAQARQRQCFTAPRARRQTPQRREQAIARLGRRIRRLEAACWDLVRQLDTLKGWLHQLTQDNATPAPWLPIVLRLDAGFSIDVNLTWLIEMGYTILTKAHSAQTTQRLLRQIGPAGTWTRVGRNAEARALGPQRIADSPYALYALLVRYQLPDAQRATTLFYSGDTAPPSDLADWFAQYNARQIIEAGIKEGKEVFALRRPLVRSPYGMQLQELFSTFAANFVRWAAQWMQQQLQAVPAIAAQVPVRLHRALSQVKTLIRVVAHCRAWLVGSASGRQLIFDAAGPFAGAILPLSDQVTIQLVLPCFHGSDSDPGG